MANVNCKQSWIAMAALALGGAALVTSLSRTDGNPAYAQPAGAADFSHLQVSGSMGGFWVFDSKNGNVFAYEQGKPTFVGRVTELGKPLAPDQAK